MAAARWNVPSEVISTKLGAIRDSRSGQCLDWTSCQKTRSSDSPPVTSVQAVGLCSFQTVHPSSRARVTRISVEVAILMDIADSTVKAQAEDCPNQWRRRCP